MGTYTYTFLAKDLMSSKMAKIGAQGKSTFTKVKTPHRRFNRDLDTTNRKLTRTSSGMGRLIGFATRLGVAFSFTQAVGGAIKLGAEFEQTKTAFETMLGSAEKGDKLIDKLFDFSNKSPFNFRSVQQSAETLLGFGVANEKVLPTMRMLGDVSRGNKERFKLMTLAYAQMQSAGKLMGQDLLQMINAGFNPLKEISEETGESMGSLRKKMEQGAISTSMVERAFQRATTKGGMFFNMMQKQSQNASGKWQIFIGKVQILTSKFMLKLMPALGRFIDWGIQVVDFMPKIPGLVNDMYNSLMKTSPVFRFLANNIEMVKTGVFALGTAWLTYKTYVGIVATATKIYTGIQWLLNGAMLANPIGLIVAGIAALAVGFTYAYNRVGWFRGAILASWEMLKGFGSAMKNLVLNRLEELMSGMKGLGQMFLDFWNGDFKKGIASGKDAFKSLSGYNGKAVNQFQKDARTAGIKSFNAYNKGVDEAAANKKKGSLLDIIKNKVGLGSTGSANGATGTPVGTNPLAGKLTSGINAINGGGSKQTHITVTFDKLVETFAINSQNIQQGFAESEEELKRMLLRVLNSTNQLQTSPV